MYDVIIIGAGHAGCEASLASARLGAKTLILTINMDTIANMPCNSAVGGPGRGQMVREIDALGGEMAKNVDRTYINMRMLNKSKGPAVQTLRGVVDKRKYFLEMKNIIENQENLDLRQGLAVDIKRVKENFRITTSDRHVFLTKSIVLCTGTFLNGKIFWGNYEKDAGRHGEINSKQLVISLRSLGMNFGRLKTDTPPRIDKKTINFNGLLEQHYDEKPQVFANGNKYDGRDQSKVYIAYVGNEAIEYIKENIGQLRQNNKNNSVSGPKYCPSIEEKVKMFPNKERHIVFIQPEGNKTNEMYLHGLMTSFAEKVQYGILKRIKGLEDSIITRPGYGVEYDYILPFQINSNLESKEYEGMFFAGQINGTTGYEEAAAQGIIAGINAAKRAMNEENIIINREDGYIGVMIDDLVTKKISQPYRMLTSRNEYRLYHRHDNADIRMVKFLDMLGMSSRANVVRRKYEIINSAANEILKTNKPGYLNQETFIKEQSSILVDKFKLSAQDINSVFIEIKYRDYIKKQKNSIDRIKNSLNLKIPACIDYEKINNISNEALISLKDNKPASIKQAKKLEGVGPADILSLIWYIRDVSRET